MGLEKLRGKIRSFRKNRPGSPKRTTLLHDNHIQGSSKPDANNNAQNAINESLTERKTFALNGDINFRMLAFAGGVSVVLTSFLSILLCLSHLDFLKVFIYAYTLLFGILICIMEGQFIKSAYLSSIRTAAIEYVPILKYLWGRGVFYSISGALQMSHMSAMNIISGVFLIAVGVLFVAIGLKTRRRMRKLKKAIKDERVLRRNFMFFDKDGDGVLDFDEFGALIANLTGEDMDEDELEGAFSVVDTSEDGLVSLEELVIWFQGFKEEESKELEGGNCGTYGMA
mmetsp:Transcript_10546/g.15404  ORF Transcript_10546/g.15404 Transcript_10546/m.15404 type:complete len:284 (+) Transcript_10546:114-965(+)|eukprot:CAMPEP_0197260956 /NCGR_PEP_ID=MMETSP1429-20130617/84299_1 /TAXON_ID=49237 /ORGANISM="Chaetoceros  sp., Strain UNC1202" /LENGTH=283 /DNA_ID=CAMNT_0042725211 /DNA_START=619 /DNA_END=1470 /DNA_ORIENTATION=+